MKKNKIIITSLVMASVLPFVGGINSARADEIKNISEKAKSDLDMARENLRLANEKKTQLENDLEQAKKAAAEKIEEKKSEEDKLVKVEENIKNNQEIIEKDKKIQEINSEIDALDKKIKAAQKEVDQAQEKYEQAEKAHKEAKNQSPDGEKFIPEDKSQELNKEYERADALLKENEKKQAKLQEKYNKNVEKRNDLSSKKEGIKEFFEEYEKNNLEKTKSPEYTDFKEKQKETYKKIDEEIRQNRDEAGPIGESLKSIGEIIEGDQKNRDDKLKAYEKHDQALAIQKDYEANNIKDLDAFEKEKHKELLQAEQKLDEAKKNYTKTLGNYQNLRIKEAEKNRELSRTKAAAKFLEERLAANEDDFVKNNADSLRQEQEIYKQKISDKEQSLQNLQTDIQKNSEDLKELYIRQSHEQEDYDKKKNSLEIIKALKEFLENKKSSKSKDQVVKELEEKMNQAKTDLEKKRVAIAELSKKDDELREMKKKIGDDIDPSVLEAAKAQLEKDRAEVEKIKAHIKELESSDDLAKVKKLEDEIKEIETKIKEIEEKIKSIENNKQRQTPGQDNNNQRERPGKDNNKNQKESQDKSTSDDYGIDLSSFSLEKIDEKAKTKNTISSLRLVVKKAKKTIARAEDFVKTSNIDEQFRADLIKLIEKQKSNIKRVEKYIEKLEASI